MRVWRVLVDKPGRRPEGRTHAGVTGSGVHGLCCYPYCCGRTTAGDAA